MIFTPAVIDTDVVIAVLAALNLAVAAIPRVSLGVCCCMLPLWPGRGEVDLSGRAGHWDHNDTAGRKSSPTHLVQAPQIQRAAAAVSTFRD